MEEDKDIKILEEKIKIIESLCTDDCINKSTVIDPLKYALENLITRYKQLEEENKELKHITQNYNAYQQKSNNSNSTIIIADKKWFRNGYFKENFIPKSKVKEKIEEINKAYEDSKDENEESQYYYPDYTIRVLEELLEKR